jgi:hypothetical protein
MAAQLDRQVSGNELRKLVGRMRPKPACQVAPKLPDGEHRQFGHSILN